MVGVVVTITVTVTLTHLYPPSDQEGIQYYCPSLNTNQVAP